MGTSSRRGQGRRGLVVPVGVVFSSTGSYGTVGEEMLHGALLARRPWLWSLLRSASLVRHAFLYAVSWLIPNVDRSWSRSPGMSQVVGETPAGTYCWPIDTII